MYMYIYIFVYIHMYVCINIYVYIYTYVWMYIYIHTYMYTHIHVIKMYSKHIDTYKCIYTYVHSHIQMYIYIYTYIYIIMISVCTRSRWCIYMWICIDVYYADRKRESAIYIYIYSHTYSPATYQQEVNFDNDDILEVIFRAVVLKFNVQAVFYTHLHLNTAIDLRLPCMLQRVAACHSELQCVAVSQCVAAYCSVLKRVAACCSMQAVLNNRPPS